MRSRKTRSRRDLPAGGMPPGWAHPCPCGSPPELLEQARRAADADDRSLSAWIRRAVEHELRRTA
jgi:hypothetical protein